VTKSRAGIIVALLVGLGLSGVATVATGQQASSHPVYCMMTATKQTALAKKTIIALDFGDQEGAFVDRTLRDELTGKAARFNTVVDALNQMAVDGWVNDGGYVLGAESANPTWVFLLRKG
jgi:hypothetical protein